MGLLAPIPQLRAHPLPPLLPSPVSCAGRAVYTETRVRLHFPLSPYSVAAVRPRAHLRSMSVRRHLIIVIHGSIGAFNPLAFIQSAISEATLALLVLFVFSTGFKPLLELQSNLVSALIYDLFHSNTRRAFKNLGLRSIKPGLESRLQTIPSSCPAGAASLRLLTIFIS
ncbi:hypothetical protein B0H15DRAFT_871799, partial [Mycena belliarum]